MPIVRLVAVPLLALVAASACSSPPRGQEPLAQAREVVAGPPAMAGVDGPLGMTAVDTPAPIWRGALPEMRSTADMMVEAARTPSTRSHWREKPRARKVRPDRHGLPQSSLSILAARPGAPRLVDRGGSPSVAQTATTPNADVATIVDTQSLPPDTMGDVGPTQYLVGLNGRIRTISKATGLRDNALDADFDVFFPSAIRNGAATSDPRVRYDRRTGRWFVIMITVAVPNRFLVAVSNGATITGSTVWSQFQWTNTRTLGGVGGAASCLADYPTLGLDEDALYVGVNQFCGSALGSVTFDSTSAYVINKTALIGGTLSVAQFDGVLPSSSAFGIYTPQGVDNFDGGTNEGYFIGVDNKQFGNLILKRVSSPAAAPSLSADINIVVPATELPEDVPHPGSAVRLDGIDDRLLQAVIRSGRLWTTHQIAVDATGAAVGTNGRNGIRWYEIGNLGPAPATPAVMQSGTVFDSAATNPVFYWMGAIMPNGQRHAALGMSKAGATTPVNAAFTGRLATDPSGVMDAPTQYSNNTAFTYNQQPADSDQRWGDYSYTSVDPDDDMTFWTLQQYVDAPDSYAVRLLRLLAPPPPLLSAVTPSSLAPGQTSAVVTVSGNGAGGRGFFDPGAGFARRLTASFGAAGVTVTNVVATSPTSLSVTLSTVGAAPGPRTLTITNPDGQSVSLASALTIRNPGANQAPTFAGAPGNTSIFDNGSGGSVGPLAFTVVDPDGDAVTLTATSSDVTVIPSNRLSTTLTGTAATVSVSSVGRLGSSTITLTASDGALSATSTFVVTVTASTVAGAPRNFAGVVARNRISLLWDAPSTASVEPVVGYRLEGGSVPGETSGALPLGPGTTYVIHAAPSGVFYLRVRAQTAAGLGPPSNEIVVATGEGGPPLAPQALLATVQGTALALQWTENPLGPIVGGYQLRAGTGPGLSDLGTAPFPASARTFAGNVPPATYYVRVYAVNAAGVSPPSNEVVLVAQPGTCTVPIAPTAVVASAIGRRLTLTWSPPQVGAIPTSYVVHAGSTSGASNVGTATLPSTPTIVSALVPPGPYFIRMFAANACGQSPASAETSVTVQ